MRYLLLPFRLVIALLFIASYLLFRGVGPDTWREVLSWVKFGAFCPWEKVFLFCLLSGNRS
jgi:hypothetical protein